MKRTLQDFCVFGSNLGAVIFGFFYQIIFEVHHSVRKPQLRRYFPKPIVCFVSVSKAETLILFVFVTISLLLIFTVANQKKTRLLAACYIHVLVCCYRRVRVREALGNRK